MNRELLKELGLDEALIEKVMTSHGQTVNKIKSDLTDAQTQLESTQNQLTERDAQLTKLGDKAEGNEDLKAEIESLKTANETEKAQLQAELQKTKLGYEIDQHLILNKARDPKVIKPLIDSETVKLDDDGKLIGLAEQLENLKASHDYLFIPEDDNPDDNTPAPSTHIPGATNKTNPRNQIDPAEAGRLKAQERHNKGEN